MSVSILMAAKGLRDQVGRVAVLRVGEVALWLELKAIVSRIQRSRVGTVEGDREVRRAKGGHPLV